MSKRAVFMVTVAGTDITPPLLPVLISLTVSDRVGTHADTATLDIDDTDGRIILPQLGAPVIKIKPPKDHIEQAEATKVFEKYGIPTKTLADRVRHCVQSAFNGKRIVIFSGGEAKDTPAVLEEVKGLAEGGAFGSIMGRNAFQRPKAEAVKLLQDVMGIFKNAK